MSGAGIPSWLLHNAKLQLRAGVLTVWGHQGRGEAPSHPPFVSALLPATWQEGADPERWVPGVELCWPLPSERAGEKCINNKPRYLHTHVLWQMAVWFVIIFSRNRFYDNIVKILN